MEINAKGLNNLLSSEEKILLIDVREVSEYNEAHIDGAVNIPLGVINNKVVEDLAKEKKASLVVFQCLSGGRSGVAIERLLKSNEADLMFKNLIGGILSWINEGLPVVKGK